MTTTPMGKHSDPSIVRRCNLPFRSAARIVGVALCIGVAVIPLAAQAPLPFPRPSPPGVTPPRDPGPLMAAGTARIRGRVVRAGTTEPIRRALVTIKDDRGGERRVTTDGEGRYELVSLPAGRFSLDAGKAGYLTLQYGQRRPFEPGRPIAIGAGETLSNVDFALPRGGVIAGRVLDNRGQPVVSAEVQVSRYQYGPNGERKLVRAGTSGVTDDRGEFRAFGLMPGSYVVNANLRQFPPPPGQTSPSGQPLAFIPTFYPGTPSEGEAQPAEVGLEQTVDVQFTMARGRIVTASGIVVDSAGRPAAGATISLATTVGSGGSSTGQGSTRPDGTFTITSVSPGPHFVQARVPPLPDGSRGMEAANLPIVAANENLSGLRVVTSSGATLTGRVEWNGTAPRARGAGDTRLRVAATTREQRPLIFGFSGINDVGSGIVGADDAFRIDGILDPVVLAVTGLPPQWMVQAVMVDGEDVTSSGVDPANLAPGADVRVVLTDRVTEVSGRVANERNEPVTEYVIVVLPEEPVPPVVAGRFVRIARPDQGGVYRTSGLPPGRYVAVAVPALEDGSQWDPVFQTTVRPVAQRFTLGEGQSVRLDLNLLR